jgi:hypothetical protein
LRRHNGKSHEHTNQIEAGAFYDFHIHRATERYQELGMREDAYAEARSHEQFKQALELLHRRRVFTVGGISYPLY